MAYEATGKLTARGPKETGQSTNGNQWSKQQFVIETLDREYPKKIAFIAFNKTIEQLIKFKKDDIVKVSFSVESRQGKNNGWFTDVKAFKIEADTPASAKPAANPAAGRGRRDYGYEDQDRFSDDDPFS